MHMFIIAKLIYFVIQICLIVVCDIKFEFSLSERKTEMFLLSVPVTNTKILLQYFIQHKH